MVSAVGRELLVVDVTISNAHSRSSLGWNRSNLRGLNTRSMQYLGEEKAFLDGYLLETSMYEESLSKRNEMKMKKNPYYTQWFKVRFEADLIIYTPVPCTVKCFCRCFVWERKVTPLLPEVIAFYTEPPPLCGWVVTADAQHLLLRVHLKRAAVRWRASLTAVQLKLMETPESDPCGRYQSGHRTCPCCQASQRWVPLLTYPVLYSSFCSVTCTRSFQRPLAICPSN